MYASERDTFLAESAVTGLAAGLGEVPALSSTTAAASGAAALSELLGAGTAPFSTLISPEQQVVAVMRRHQLWML